jgi:predicted alpha/beta superfamily hydrolase
MGRIFAAVLALVIFSGQAPLTIERTEQLALASKANGVAYKLYVSLPHDYDPAAKKYPVVYLLDADYSFLIARNITDHLAERNDLPPVILVGIAYDGPPQYRMNRTRDYTPVFVPTGGYGPEYQKVSGGAPKFKQFLETELIPFIDATYATIPGDRCLVGHSYGGLFGAWTLLTSSSLFKRYIIVSPSLWYDDRLPARLERKLAAKHPPLDARVYMGVGDSEDPQMPADFRAMAAQLRKHKYAGLALSADVLNHENHNTVFPRALSNGLRWVFGVR